VLLKAYDDARGLGAAWSKNFLARLNRELGARFELERFRHVAIWNDDEARVEVYLESTVAQTVAIDGAGQTVSLHAGERILTEVGARYDNRRIELLLQGSGFARIRTFHDPERRFAVQVAHAQ
jgi:L-histidine Nalpha-methyltransferase